MAYTTIDDPTIYFNTKLYTGNGSTQSITGVGFQPDWLWIKNRDGSNNHILQDVIRGATKSLESDSKTSEVTSSTRVTSFDSDGFSIGSPGTNNTNTNNYVSWNWLAGGSASSNSDGGITSSISANTDAGFSIVTWSGNGSAATIGHGLSSAPKWIILKARNNSNYAWFVGHEKLDSSIPWNKYMTLENTNALNDDVIWNDTAPTSSVFSVGNYASTNGSGVNFVAYCFLEKKGYSKFGSYTGNGNADGTFVYTGFKPAWVMIKNISTADPWLMLDNKRDTFNPMEKRLDADDTDAEATGTDYADFLSNGFKIIGNLGIHNNSNQNYIYMAFAESPFVNSNGIPTNAR